MKRKMGLDWLRDYRLERGLSADPVVHQSAAPLLLKGSALGAVLVLIPVTLWIGLGFISIDCSRMSLSLPLWKRGWAMPSPGCRAWPRSARL